jgi:hypothetical protein
VRIRISDLKKRRRSHEPAGREKLVVLTRLIQVALLGLPARKLSLLVVRLQWGT